MNEETILTPLTSNRVPWNRGKLIGAKPPLRQKHVWAIRGMLQNGRNKRDLAMFNLALDSKLRGCDVVVLRWKTLLPTATRLTGQRSVRERPGDPFGLN
jgi:hypothetical protein